MRILALLLAGAFVATVGNAQERWRQLPGAAGAFAVELQSIAVEGGVLQARVRTPDRGTLVLVEELEIRCTGEQLRTIAKHQYDNDTGRPVPATGPDDRQDNAPWVAYAPGSEGYALVSSLCRLARDRNLFGSAEHSRA